MIRNPRSFVGTISEHKIGLGGPAFDVIKAIFLGATFAALVSTASAQEKITRSQPFGPLTGVDFEHLQEFAQNAGFDMKADVARIYSRGRSIDGDALGRLFSFSLAFDKFDDDARAYGQVLLNSFRYLGEGYGVGVALI